jgi:glyoxylase-like metal-dependent hydrolase (beta-lactamase superfamily II)
MNIKSFVFNPFYENTYVISSNDKNAFIFDPGCYEDFEINEICQYIDEQQLNVKAIVNTHCHIDHVLGNKTLKEKFNCPLMIPKREEEIFNAVVTYAPQWGITNYQHAEVDKFLLEKGSLQLDEVTFSLIEVSGHSPGHLIFYEESEQTIIGGDVLFRESIGRTDLPGGNHDELLTNIREKVYTLPEEVTVYPGHGPETTIGYEKKYNPFVKG